MIGSRDRKPPAPTRRLGDGRRRFLFRRVVGLVTVAMVVVGCAGSGLGDTARPAVAAGPSGPILVPVGAKGPPIECRGLAQDRCLNAGSVEGSVGGVAVTDIERVIVSCEGAPCTAAGGAMRVDVVLRDGTTVDVARGGYGEFRQP